MGESEGYCSVRIRCCSVVSSCGWRLERLRWPTPPSLFLAYASCPPVALPHRTCSYVRAKRFPELLETLTSEFSVTMRCWYIYCCFRLWLLVLF